MSETIDKTQPIVDINQIKRIQNQIQKSISVFIENIEFINQIQNIQIHQHTTEETQEPSQTTLKNKLKDLETQYDQTFEIYQRYYTLIEFHKSIIESFENFQSETYSFISSTSEQKEIYGNKINSLMDEMLSTEEKIQPCSQKYIENNYTSWKLTTKQYEEELETSQKSMKKSEELRQRSIEKQLDSENRSLRYEMMKKQYKLTEAESEQLEEWTWLKFGPILFDSKKDNIKENRCELIERIVGKSNVLFLIEDKQKNKFGYFQSTPFENTTNVWLPTDEKAFVFSLESNGRIDYPLKCEIKDTKNGYKLFLKNDNRLIAFGSNAILLKKHQMKDKSYCEQKDNIFDYHNRSTVLTGKDYPNWHFTPKRILVFEMLPLCQE